MIMLKEYKATWNGFVSRRLMNLFSIHRKSTYWANARDMIHIMEGLYLINSGLSFDKT